MDCAEVFDTAIIMVVAVVVYVIISFITAHFDRKYHYERGWLDGFKKGSNGK